MPVQKLKSESMQEEDESQHIPSIEDEEENPRKRIKHEDSEEARYAQSRHCPYLDTINRQVLDFDFEKLCSVSLSHLNVYACLVCGKYFQGDALVMDGLEHKIMSAVNMRFRNVLVCHSVCVCV
jgi:hypothetical protein